MINILDYILQGSLLEEDITQLRRSLNMTDSVLLLVSQDDIVEIVTRKHETAEYSDRLEFKRKLPFYICQRG
ncbi:MAG: hypothetical protein RMX63_08495 [Aulosira sp. ZfuCHP01]|nr:hypothetical protein [Aulosira sp. ZfuVER01]MDZ7999803.1 hypothetical protein [Aulosira sp. DedVER01a]MDZ8051491.1 hypothetical protein [Aulosira sp. ZfuCHP01]